MIRGVLAVALVASGLQGQAAAQAADRTVEALGFVGTVTDGGGLTFGGGMQFGYSSRLLIAAEVGFLTLGDDFSGFGVDTDSSGLSVDVNAHYLFPLANNPKLTPYALGGLGFIRVSTSGSVAGFDVGGSSSDVGLNIGGGLRYTLSENSGIRPEIKFLIKDGSSTRISVAYYRSF